jgi:hypothetical protein
MIAGHALFHLTPLLSFPCAWTHQSFPSHNPIVPVCRLLESNRRWQLSATMHWSRLRDKESALADVIRLSTVQTKKGFESRNSFLIQKLLDRQDIHNPISRYSPRQHPAAV